MLDNEFLYSDVLAYDYIESVARLKKLVKAGKIEESLSALDELAYSMNITLATAQLHDQPIIN